VELYLRVPELLHGVVLINARGNLSLGTLASFRKAPITFVMSVRLSSYISEAPTGRILMKLIWGTFIFKNLLRNPNLVKIGQNYLAL